MQQLLADLRKGHVSQTDESVFEVGRNVATSEGSVVFENELFQLIEYKPLTAKVHERPMLFVPPCINKYYILDLQPENSVIRYTVEQGHRTFVDELAQPRRSRWSARPGTTTSSTGRSPPSATVQAITGAETDQHAGLLRRRHDPGHRAGRAGRARRAAGAVGDAADHAAGLRRHRHPRRLRRRSLGAVARDDHRRAGAAAARACSRARNWPPSSASCAPTTWCGTMSSATT